jgi:hypothetical protein
VVGVEAYEHTQHKLELLQLLARGENEVEAGKGYDLDSVFAEAETLIAETSR